MPSSSHKKDQRAIGELDVAWGKAATRGDLDAVVAFYADDACVLWPGAAVARGKAHVRAAWKQAFADYKGLKLKFTAKQVIVAHDADLATDLGRVDFGHVTAQGPVMNVGKYVVVWKKVRGSWKVLYDCYNMNQPGS